MFISLVEFPKIKDGREAEFERWFASSTELFAKFPGFVARRLLKPTQNAERYAAIVEHESEATFLAMQTSPEHQTAWDKVSPLLEGAPTVRSYEVADTTIKHSGPSPDWDPRDPAVLRDQRKAYDEMRQRCPVAYSDFLGWSLFGYEDVLAATRDVKTFSNATKRHPIPNGWDPPEHTRYRSLLDPYFSAQRMAAFEPRCRQIAIDLLQPLVAQGDAEFIDDFVEPYLLSALCAFCGWPHDDWARLRDWTRANQHAAFTAEHDAAGALARDFSAYVGHQLATRRTREAASDEDLTASLLMLTLDEKGLSDEDLVGLLRNFAAGTSTTVGATGIAALYLVEHPEMQAHLRADSSLVPAFVEEILRSDGPLVANSRTAKTDTAVHGRTIPAGAHVSLMWIAANRDDRAFPEPDAIRFDRDLSKHLAFGAGIHTCLGAPLVRLEMRVALEELLARAPSIQLAAADPPSRGVFPGDSPRTLSVRFGRPG